MGIETIAFDLGGVLVPNVEREINEAAVNLLEISAEEYNKFFFGLIHQTTIGNMTLSEYYEKAVKHFKRGDRDKLLERHIRIHSAIFEHKDKKILDLIERLKEKYKVVSLTNIEPEIMKNTEREGIYELFEENYISCLMGLMKPNSDIYLDMLKDLKATPNEVLFIDDKYENVATARRLGINAIQFKNSDELVEEMRDKYGISI